MTLCVDYMDPNIENNQANTTQLTFAYMVMFLHAKTVSLYLLFNVNENAETGFFVERHSVRKTLIRLYAVSRLKIKL